MQFASLRRKRRHPAIWETLIYHIPALAQSSIPRHWNPAPTPATPPKSPSTKTTTPSSHRPRTAGTKSAKRTPHGKLELVEYDSETVGTKRKLNLYTPPGYSDDARKDKHYPVLYLLHGIGGNETEWARFAAPDILPVTSSPTAKPSP